MLTESEIFWLSTEEVRRMIGGPLGFAFFFVLVAAGKLLGLAGVRGMLADRPVLRQRGTTVFTQPVALRLHATKPLTSRLPRFLRILSSKVG